jgi:hypothetical protein
VPVNIDPDAPWWVNVLLLLLVGTVPAVVAWLTSRRTRKDVSGIHNQVTNSHTKNFRDEVTEGFAEVLSRLDGQDKKAAEQDQRADTLSGRVTALSKRLTTHIDSRG